MHPARIRRRAPEDRTAPAARGVVPAACLATTLVPLGSTSLAVALPGIGRAFSAGVGQLVVLVSAYLVVTAACQPVAGTLGDRWGRRRTTLTGTAGFGAVSLVAAAAPDLPVLVALRCLQAAFGALALVNAAAAVRTTVPAQQRGRAIGALGSSATAAAAAGPLAGGAAVHVIGWRGAFLVGLPLAVLALVALHRALPGNAPTPHPRPAGLDLPGVALLLALLGGAAALLENVRALSPPLLAAACAGLVIVAAAFARRELRQEHPVLDVRVLRLRPVLAAGAAVASGNAALYTVLLAVPLLVGSDRAVPLLLCLLVGASAGSLLGGRLSDRWGRRRPAVLGGILLALSSGGLVVVHLAPVGLAAAALLVTCGVGQGLAAAAVQTAGLEALPPERAGLASGVWSTSRYLGSIVGSSLLAVLVAGGSGRGVFALAAVGGALSVLAAAALPAPAPARDGR